jgi:succinate dehydrogenase hydrophobic anchor subunit
MQSAIPRNPAVLGSGTNASLGWLVQAVSGILLIALLGLHMVANHFVVEGGLQTYQDVVNYFSNPLIVVLELFFLSFVTLHALLGVRAIVLDFGIKASSEARLNRFLTVLGVLIVLYGMGLTFLIISRG